MTGDVRHGPDSTASCAKPESVAAKISHGLIDYRTICAEHADEREAIRQQILAEYRERTPDFGNSTGGRWMVGFLTHKRFTIYMTEKYDLVPPDRGTAKHPIIYGMDRKGQA